MQFFNRRAIAAYLAFGLVAFMTACGGYGGQSSADKKAATTVAQVQMFPAPSVSLRPGEVQQMSAAALNVNGSQVFTATISFSSSNPAIEITQNGLLCAGRWDNLSNPVVCFAPGTGPVTNPPTPPPDPAVTAAGITSNITASAGGVTSPVTVASVHLAITSISVNPTAPACVAEKGTQVFTAQAFNGATDITTSVGTFNWTSANVNVATIPATGDTGQTSQATATAVHPGQTNITASIGTVTPISSVPVVFTQCLVKTIAVTVGTPDSTKTPPEDASHFTVATSASRALTATVMDSTGATLTTLPTLNWTTTQPSIAAVNGSGSVNGVAPGVVGISAACVPNNCNIGSTLTVTSNAVSGTVTGTAPTSATAYVTCNTDDHMATTPVCTTAPTSTTTQTQLFPISGTTVGTAINLPHTPNSMMINPQNSKIYLGSSAGLMVVDAGANAFSTTVINAPGSVLTVAPNGSAVVVSSGTDVFLYNGNTVALLLDGTTHIVGATAAGFSPDSTKLLISTNTGQLWFETPGSTPNHSAVAAASSIAWFPSGQFGAVSRNGTTDLVNANPDASNAPVVDSSQGCGGFVAPVPQLDGGGHDQVFAANPGGTMCLLNSAPGITTFAVTAFPITELFLSSDGAHAYMLGGTSVVKDNVIGTTTVNDITLSSGNATTGGVTTNGTLYVGDGAGMKVHQITFPGGIATDTPITTTVPADLVVTKK